MAAMKQAAVSRQAQSQQLRPHPTDMHRTLLQTR